MGTDEQGADYRLEVLRQLKEKYNQPDPPEVLKNRQSKAETYEQILRAESPLDDPDSCWDCWVFHGERRKMIPQESGYGTDTFQCANGHVRHARHW
jgi:hypothetical protein